MNIFQLINKLLFAKKESFEDLDHESLQSFQPYMLNRWFSFYGKAQAVFVNNILNRSSHLFEDKNEMFKYYFYQTPKVSYKKIAYIKKTKKEDVEKKYEHIDVIARNKCISQREVKQYIDLSERFCK